MGISKLMWGGGGVVFARQNEVRKFFKIIDEDLFGKSHSNVDSIGLRSSVIHSVCQLTSLYNIALYSNQSNWLFYFNRDVAGCVLFLFLVVSNPWINST